MGCVLGFVFDWSRNLGGDFFLRIFPSRGKKNVCLSLYFLDPLNLTWEVSLFMIRRKTAFANACIYLYVQIQYLKK